MADETFDEVREQAAEAVTDEELVSVYAGLVREDGRREYYFANDIDDGHRLRETAAVQLGTLLRVLADRSELSVEEIAELAVEYAEGMETR